MKKSKKKPVAKKKPARPVIDSIGRTYRIDATVLRRRLESNISGLVETGVRQFLGIEERPTPQMIEFLHSIGVITTRSGDAVELGQQLYS